MLRDVNNAALHVAAFACNIEIVLFVFLNSQFCYIQSDHELLRLNNFDCLTSGIPL